MALPRDAMGLFAVRDCGFPCVVKAKVKEYLLVMMMLSHSYRVTLVHVDRLQHCP